MIFLSMKKNILIAVFLFILTHLYSQISLTDFQSQLQSAGITESELTNALSGKGINLSNINPSDLQSLQTTITQTIGELDAAKKNAAAAPSTPPVNTNPSAAAMPPPPTPVATSVDTIPVQPEMTSAVTIADSMGLVPDTVVTENILFGFDIFKKQNVGVYQNADATSVPGNYILGPEDVISINIWGGISEFTFSFTISQDGFINPPSMQRISLKGMRYDQAQKFLEDRFSKYYRFGKGNFSASLTKVRNITVNVTGEVANYGSYTLPATNTAFNALVAAGGSTENGTLRNIELIRAGQPRKRLDMYEFLLDPSVVRDFFLQDNDYVHIPVAGRIINIKGAVRRPMRYELINNEQLIKLIEFAGGLNYDAYTNNVTVKRFVDNEERLLDVNLKELIDNKKDFGLLNGDEITILKVPKSYQNYVEAFGEVDFPQQFSLVKGMKISDLAKLAVIKKESRTDLAYVQRLNPDNTYQYVIINIDSILLNPADARNFELRPYDKLVIFEKALFVDESKFVVEGSVRQPGELPFNSNDSLKVADAIMISGGLASNALDTAYIKRVNPENKQEVTFIPFNVKTAISNPTSADNIYVKRDDIITVYSKEQFSDTYIVSITGAVRQPGEFVYDKTMRVSDLLYFSSGLKPDAFDWAYVTRTDPSNPKLVEYFRVNVKEITNNIASPDNIVLKPQDKLEVLSKSTFLLTSSVSVNGEVKAPGVFDYDKTLTLWDVLTKAGGFQLQAATNRIDISRIVIKNNEPTKSVVATVEVDRDLLNIDKANAIKLEPYDQIFVRTVPDFEMQQNVSVEGEVMYPGTYSLVSKNEKLSSIIDRAGGLTLESFPAGATLSRMKDSLGYIVSKLDKVMLNKNSKYNYVLMHGDKIFVPKTKDLVTILGETKAKDLYPDELLSNKNKINVPFHKSKGAFFYVRKYAAGVGKEGKHSDISVLHLTGEMKKTKNFGLFKIYPKVKKGSIVTVGKKEQKPEDVAAAPKEPVDWGQVLADSIAQATSILTLLILIQNINK